MPRARPLGSDEISRLASLARTPGGGSWPEGVGEGVFDRRWQFCPTVLEQNLKPDSLIVECAHCNRYFAYCCKCDDRGFHGLPEHPVICHHLPLIYVDGACSQNGKGNAVSGIGGTWGVRETHSFSLPVTQDLDAAGRRTSQRAELLAAIEGIETLVDLYRLELDEKLQSDKRDWVVVSDSEYTVNGMTDWVLRWKARGWKTASNTVPANLALFKTLDDLVIHLESMNVYVGFWWVSRKYNGMADSFAKEAVQKALAMPAAEVLGGVS